MEIFEDNLVLQAKEFTIAKLEYAYEFKVLLKEIYKNYEFLIEDNIIVPKNENKIRDILVDDYLSKNIKDYIFKKEEKNNLGRVDIFIQESIDNEPAEFIIECKLLDNKNCSGKDGLNGKYITNGIQRFLPNLNPKCNFYKKRGNLNVSNPKNLIYPQLQKLLA